jgi:hypothetical protein
VKVRRAASGGPIEPFFSPGLDLDWSSPACESLQGWVEIAQNAPEMRAEQIETLRRAVRNGRYFVSTEELVEVLFTELLVTDSSLSPA